MEIIKCEELSFSYPKTEYPVIKNITFALNKGEFCLLIGESAVGKSTLIKLLKKEIAPFGALDGSISVNGSVGYVAQNVDESIVSDKVRSELSFGLTNMGVLGDTVELLVAETASYFNLEDKLDADISSLSGGEKQMVNLASVMIMKPDVLLLDEPTSQLDPVSSQRFIQMIAKLHKDFGTTILMSEHNLENAIDLADSIALMQSGANLVKSNVCEMVNYIKNNAPNLSRILPVNMLVDVDNLPKAIQTENVVFNDVALDVKHISFAYNRGNDILNDLSLKVYKGKINAVLGPNSSGKSTLLKVASGVKKQYRGKVKTSGKISYLCQNVFDLFTKEKCSDEVDFGKTTTFLGIDYIADMHPYDLSGGEAQRLAIAMVLQTGADIILLDEPTKGFDPVIKQKLADILRELCDMGKTILIVSHDIEFVGEYADYVSFLSRGKIITTQPRKSFFSSLSFYTTSLAKLTNGEIVSLDDYKKSGGAI